MRVALLVPCYVDQLAPRVAWASVALLERLGCSVEYDAEQACCGQPLWNAGDAAAGRQLAGRLLERFVGAEHVVAPSASCVATLRRLSGTAHVRELCEFLVEALGVEALEGRYARRVGLHPSCHGLRELRLGTASEGARPGRDPARQLLGSLSGLELVAPTRPDECCGFGGSFAVSEAAVSEAMGRDRLSAHRGAGAEVLTATDVSCLLHLEGLGRRADSPLEFRHVAEILEEATA